MVACVCNYSTPEHQEGRGGQKITLEVHEPGVSSKRQTKDPAWNKIEGQDQPMRFSTCTSSHRYTNKHLKRFLCLNAAWCCAALEWALYLCFTPFHLGNCTSKGRLPGLGNGPLCVRREMPARKALSWGFMECEQNHWRRKLQTTKWEVPCWQKLKGLYSVWDFQTVTFQGSWAFTHGKPCIWNLMGDVLPFWSITTVIFPSLPPFYFPFIHLLTFTRDY